MSEEKFDYREFAQSIYEQSYALMPDDIGDADKEYLATTMKNFSQIVAEDIINKYQEPPTNIIMFISQVVTEWTFHKGLDIIRAGIPKELRDSILQDTAFIIYRTLENSISQEINQEKLIIDVKNAMKREFKKIIKKFYLNKAISKEVALRAIKLSNIDSVINITDESMSVEQEKDFFELDDKDLDLIEHHVAQEEYIATEQEKNQKNEYRRNYFKNMIQEKPDNPQGYTYINDLERLIDNNPQKAMESVNKAIELDSNNGEAYIARARIYVSLAEKDMTVDFVNKSWSDFYEKAIDDYTKALGLITDNTDKGIAFFERGKARLSAWDEEGACDDFEASIEINPSYMEPCFELAKRKRSIANYMDAIKYFDKAINIVPNNDELYYERGQAKEWSGNIEGAKEDYIRGLEINPNNIYLSNALNGIRMITQQDKEFNQEYKKLTQFINENPNNPEGYYNRGYFLSCHEIDDEIILSDINKAIELNPKYTEAYRTRAYIYEYMGEYDKIITDYKKIIELEPTYENYDYYIRYLNTYIEGGAQKALKVIETVFGLFPASGELYQLRGGVYYHLQDYDNAIANYKKAIELNPHNDSWRRILKQIEQEKQKNLS